MRNKKNEPPGGARRRQAENARNNGGFTFIELSVSLFIFLFLALSLLNFQKIYASYQLKFYSRQLVSDIRYIQQQSIMNLDLGRDLPYKIKFLSNDNSYQIWRGDMELKKEVKLPNTLEMYYGGAGEPFNPDPLKPWVRVLAYKATGEIATNTGTVNLRDKVNSKAVGIVVHRIRVRIGEPNEVAD